MVWVYRLEKGKQVLLAPAHALNLETEQLSLEEAKAASQQFRKASKDINNKSIIIEFQNQTCNMQRH
ncbi:MAG: hypothetical protein N2235_10005 [Fischerella sp.]|nr:hypothetical protein [Fischerella sp.]